MTQSLGIDISRYNALVDWQVAAARGVRFAGIRMTISWAYRDPFGTSNLQGAQSVGIRRMPYAVLYPGEDPARQVANLMQACGDIWDEAVPVLDAELAHGYGKAHITDTLLAWLDNCETETGLQPILYSRADWINTYTETGAWRNQQRWWLAHYLFTPEERPSPPLLPVGVTNWLIHQTADKIPAWPGLQSGGITTCDTDRWNGDDAAVAAWFGGPLPVMTWPGAIDAWARTLGYTGPLP